MATRGPNYRRTVRNRETTNLGGLQAGKKSAKPKMDERTQRLIPHLGALLAEWDHRIPGVQPRILEELHEKEVRAKIALTLLLQRMHAMARGEHERQFTLTELQDAVGEQMGELAPTGYDSFRRNWVHPLKQQDILLQSRAREPLALNPEFIERHRR